MKSADTTAPRIAKGAQPAFFDQPAMEGMYGMMIVLLEEICVLSDRLDTYERLGAQGISVTPEAVDAFTPDSDAEAAREQSRQAIIRRAMRPIRQLQEAAVNRAQSRYESDARAIAERDV
jgi:hypothetical protein